MYCLLQDFYLRCIFFLLRKVNLFRLGFQFQFQFFLVLMLLCFYLCSFNVMRFFSNFCETFKDKSCKVLNYELSKVFILYKRLLKKLKRNLFTKIVLNKMRTITKYIQSFDSSSTSFWNGFFESSLLFILLGFWVSDCLID